MTNVLAMALAATVLAWAGMTAWSTLDRAVNEDLDRGSLGLAVNTENPENPEGPQGPYVNPENPENPGNPSSNPENPENPSPNTENPENPGNPSSNPENPQNPSPNTENPENPSNNPENPEGPEGPTLVAAHLPGSSSYTADLSAGIAIALVGGLLLTVILRRRLGNNA